MKIFFNDTDNDISFEYHDAIITKNIFLKKGSLNLRALYLYGMYRNTIYDSYKKKANLAEDIKTYKKVFFEQENSKLTHNNLSNDPLYHYSIAASLGAIMAWQNPNEKMQSYCAYQESNGHKKIIGFVHFTEKKVNDQSVIYIAQAGVINRGNGVGRRLMECVLSHYPSGTNFKILTRVFNDEAKTLYSKRLNFTSISAEEVKQLGYDERYCGFEHTTTSEEILAIKDKQSLTQTNLNKAGPSINNGYVPTIRIL